jgi:hypothetical protein
VGGTRHQHRYGDQLDGGADVSLTSVWVGAVTSSAAWVRAKVSTGDSVRLGVQTSPALDNPTFFEASPPTVYGMVSGRATGLDPNTQYWYALEINGILDTAFQGRFHTHPTVGAAASFAFGVSSCAGLEPLTPGAGAVLRSDRISNHTGFDTIRERAISDGWLMFAHIGDMHYYNPGSGTFVTGSDADLFRRCWDDVLLQPRQHRLYREVPLVYAWDDHDYGPNDSDSTAPGRLNAQRVYREKVPHYSLPAEAEADGNQPIYHSIQIGRVLIIASDTRSSRTAGTMLGQQQKDWMRTRLATTSAEFLVWLTPTPWFSGENGATGADTWANFPDEAAELVAMFTDTGFIDRMVAVTGDTHHMALDSGSAVSPGGIPLFVFGPIDSRSNTGSGVAYDVGSTNDQASDTVRSMYGVIDVQDSGSQITVTGAGFIAGNSWLSHSVTVAVEDNGDEDEPERPDVAVAEVRTHVTWLGCDLISGRIIAELPDITGNVKRVLGSSTSTGLTLPVPLAGPGALGELAWQATAPGRTMIVPVVNDVPSWGGIVLTRKGGTNATLDLGCISLEGYLDRRYVTDHEWTNIDEAMIAAGLAADAMAEGIGLTIDAPRTGTKRSRSYADSDDATVYSRLRELMGVDGGPEWTIDVDWADHTKRAVAKILRIRKRIGTAATSPEAVFETTAPSVFSSRGASEATYSYTEDYSTDRGANHILATSSGEGNDRPASIPARDVRPGWPRFERRFTPSTSIKDNAVLDEHARSELALLRDGSATWDITTRWDTYPRLNVDWRLGDDVAWNVVGHRHPQGVTGQGRVIGWDLDMKAGVVTPILLDPQEGTAQ